MISHAYRPSSPKLCACDDSTQARDDTTQTRDDSTQARYRPSSPVGYEPIDKAESQPYFNLSGEETAWFPNDFNEQTRNEEAFASRASAAYTFQYSDYECAPEEIDAPEDNAEEFEWALYELDYMLKTSKAIEAPSQWLRCAWPKRSNLFCELSALVYLQDNAGVQWYRKRYDMRPHASYVLSLNVACAILRDRIVPTHKQTPQNLLERFRKHLRLVRCREDGGHFTERASEYHYYRVAVHDFAPLLRQARTYARKYAGALSYQ